MKNYIGFLNDESGSMHALGRAAVADYNANVNAFAGAATKYMQDTIVSMFGFNSSTVTRYVVNSNPHVLKPLTSWKSSGGTPLRKGIMAMIDLFKSMPDYNDPKVSFTLLATTDGEADHHDLYTIEQVGREIAELSRTGRWTFVFRVPRGGRRYLNGLNIPEGNIQEWDTTEAGMAASTVATTAAVDTFYATRAAGKMSSNVFYANATAVDTTKLVDISARTSLYVVEAHEDASQIRDFILRRRSRYLKGAAFYQLTKTEARVGPNKMLAVRDRTTGVVYAGKEARTMLGLSSVDNIRLHPGNHGNYDLFIQSESVNRKLIKGTGVLYWEEIGVPFTQEEIDRFTGPAVASTVKPTVVRLAAVPVSNKPTPSPLKPVPAISVSQMVNGRVVLFSATRDGGRELARNYGKRLEDLNNYPNAVVVGPRHSRWFVFA